MDKRVIIEVPQGVNKVRLEDFLLDHFSRLSKMYLREVVKRELCEVNGRPENIGYRLRPNDLIEIVLEPDRETAMLPEDISLDVTYEDNDIVVVNKPAGMLTHPSHRENSGTLLNALAYYLNRAAFRVARTDPGDGSRPPTPPPAYSGGADMIRPGLVHRLDKQTSGLIVVAKNARAHRLLSGDFMKKRVEKRYLALVEGIVVENEGTIEAPIGRFEELKQWSVKEGGKHSETRFWVRKRHADTTLLELEPVTGRTNQLRIHCELIGHTIVGDIQRGGNEFGRLCLHAYRLSFPHPTTRERVSLESSIPVEFDGVDGGI